MKCGGFFGIGVENMKTDVNFGTLFRTAQIFNADFIFLIGRRFKKQPSDTMKSWKHMPLYEYYDFDDYNKHRPYDSLLIGVELDSRAIEIRHFSHPKQCAYLLGAEDHGLTKMALNKCNSIIKLPGDRSLNVSVAGSIVLYDRLTKASL